MYVQSVVVLRTGICYRDAAHPIVYQRMWVQHSWVGIRRDALRTVDNDTDGELPAALTIARMPTETCLIICLLVTSVHLRSRSFALEERLRRWPWAPPRATDCVLEPGRECSVYGRSPKPPRPVRQKG